MLHEKSGTFEKQCVIECFSKNVESGAVNKSESYAETKGLEKTPRKSMSISPALIWDPFCPWVSTSAPN